MNQNYIFSPGMDISDNLIKAIPRSYSGKGNGSRSNTRILYATP
ncbi:hypothetical protein MEG1DRAFT_01078 [Photorhabdus temperata subsp. temperata Meg1]|uniref:Uncharacterized protein n=1 Tax=Photorhabdus temperata subsp. temperata Meg1 TaxID=1393735 RepID=A0A081RZW0_PHOTE|nr:hypothetical protein MEG1DRAFT_01078 [Photorhabdus temperata subsp. temperata Meg1]